MDCCDEAIAALRDGFDDGLSAAVSVGGEGFAQDGDVAGKAALFDESAGPDGFKQFLFINDAAVALDQEEKCF